MQLNNSPIVCQTYRNWGLHTHKFGEREREEEEEERQQGAAREREGGGETETEKRSKKIIFYLVRKIKTKNAISSKYVELQFYLCMIKLN